MVNLKPKPRVSLSQRSKGQILIKIFDEDDKLTKNYLLTRTRNTAKTVFFFLLWDKVESYPRLQATGTEI